MWIKIVAIDIVSWFVVWLCYVHVSITSGHWLHINGEWRQYVHIYAMVRVTRFEIDELVDALHVQSAFT